MGASPALPWARPLTAVDPASTAGARLRVTVRGRPVADLVPVERRRTFLPRSEVLQMINEAPLDARFRADVGEAIDEAID